VFTPISLRRPPYGQMEIPDPVSARVIIPLSAEVSACAMGFWVWVGVDNLLIVPGPSPLMAAYRRLHGWGSLPPPTLPTALRG